MIKIDLNNPYKPVKKNVEYYGGVPDGLENYCSGKCRGVKTLQKYPIVNTLKQKNIVRDILDEPMDFYEVSSTVYPESGREFVQVFPSNTSNTLLEINDSTKEHIIYPNGKEKIILDKPEFTRVRKKLKSGKWVLKEYAIKDPCYGETSLLFKNGKLLIFDSERLKKGINPLGLTRNEKEKISKSIQKLFTKITKNLLKK